MFNEAVRLSQANNFTTATMGSIIIGRSFGNQIIESNCGILINVEIINNNNNKMIAASIHNAYGIPQALTIITE